ncbi:hypothetical protein [Aquimarina sp. RZ0]|uniref:WD40/YVTN/BNR-like repeat-containing protein n=1 Tax=Aquimarina sp. RZ0 TaxID=2607730 RepID=UPI00165F0F88|nr:hypothetical protein [Aquimarina sp. RZ0]
MNWKLTNIPSETGSISFDYKFNQYHILDTLTGFIIGNNSIAEISNSVKENRPRDKQNYETILFTTIDGGISFEKSTLGKGNLKQMTSDTQKNLYLIKNTYKTDSKPEKNSILRSTDLGKTWKEISNFNTQKIRNVQFYDTLKGVVSIGNNNKKIQLLTTIDGGQSWQELKVNKTGVNIYDVIFLNENELYTFYKNGNLEQTVSINFTTGNTKIHLCNLPKNYRFDSFFRDDTTDSLYSKVVNPKELHPLMIYNHTSQQLTTYDFENHQDESIVGVNISREYIGVLRNDNGKTFYYYSRDHGKNWTKESLPDYLADSRPVALFGKGGVWVKSIKNLYNLQVRRSSEF